ncbi:MAG: solute carrier family 23 protein [Aliidongia sp.]
MALTDGKTPVAAHSVFEVGFNDKVPLRDAIAMGFQNVFVMTGIFVFPGIMGRSFDLPLDTVAYLYGMTFIGCGVTSLLISMFFGRVPLVAGPYAGIFTAILTFGHLPNGDLGTAFGSLFVASLLWALLAIPIRGVSFVSLISKAIRTPAIAGVIVMLVMMQIADLALPHWLGKPGDGSFPLINFTAGLVTALVLMVLTVSQRPTVRRLSLLLALVVGAAFFEMFNPINFAAVARSPWFVRPVLFPFGASFNLEFCAIFFVVLVAVNIQTMTIMGVVGGWADEKMPPSRLSHGVLAMALGSAVASVIGSFSNIPYPANVAMLRSTGVASRYVTFATSIILILMGFCTKIDYVFVLLPVPVLSAAATVLFGMVFVHGIEMLSKVEWDRRNLTIAGFSLMVGFGCLFLEPPTLAAMPFFLSLILRQPIIVGVFSVVVLGVILPGGSRSAEERKPSLEPAAHGSTRRQA